MPDTALVTGAANGIGRSITLMLASRGFDLCLVDRDSETLKALESQLVGTGINVTTLDLDVSDAVSTEEQIESAINRTAIGILINNAGTAVAADLPHTEREEWHRIFDVNVHAIYEISRLIIPHMARNGGGVIVNISSVAGMVGLQSRAAYCASKGAVISLTRAMAIDHAKDNIRVNAVCPGTILTGWIDEILSGNSDPVEARRNMEERQVLGRLGEPEEVASAVMFLIENEFATGSALVVDGGLTAR